MLIRSKYMTTEMPVGKCTECDAQFIECERCTECNEKISKSKCNSCADSKCNSCKKPFCSTHLNKLACTCKFTLYSFHLLCYAGDRVCISCLPDFTDDSNVLANMKDVGKLLEIRDKQLLEQEMKNRELQIKYDFLKIEHDIHMKVYHQDDNLDAKKRKMT